jgi:hypothetical protein
MAKITFNGRDYDSFEALPPEAQEALRHSASFLSDKNHNGLPDLLEGDNRERNVHLRHSTTTLTTGNVQDFDTVPEELRHLFSAEAESGAALPATPLPKRKGRAQ